MSSGLSERVFRSFRCYPRFRLLWTSNLFFFGGAWTQTLILGWLVFERTGSELLLAVFGAARLAPMLLGPLGGVVSDRVHRPRLLLVASTWSLLAVMVVAALVSADRLPYWGLVLGGFCIGIAHSPSQPARATLVMDLVGRESLANANALNAIVMHLTQVIGPAVGGALIGVVGAPRALWLSALWYLVSLVALWPLRNVGRADVRPRREPFLRSLREGLGEVARNRLLAAALAITLAANLTLWPIHQSFMPVFAELLELDATGLGWLLACGGLGGVVGSLAIAALGDFRAKGALFVFGTAAWGACWALFSLSQSAALSFVLFACVGLAGSAFGVLQSTLLLMMTAPAVRGRVLGIQELAIGAQPLATMVLGVAAEYAGVGMTARIGVLALAGFALLVAVRLPALTRYTGVEVPSSTSTARTARD